MILSVDSPGGTSTTGAEALYDELRRLAEKKPTVAVVDGVTPRERHIAALAAGSIVVRTIPSRRLDRRADADAQRPLS